MKKTRLVYGLTAVAFLFAAGPASAAKETLVFSAAPGDGPDVALYKPLLDVVAKASGKKVDVQVAANYVEYARAMRSGAYDLVFDSSHFAAWRMAKAGQVGLARLPGEARVVVVTRQDGPKTLDELAAGRRVCVLPSPQLSNLAFEHQFQNPTRQPVMVVVHGANELKDCLTSKKAEAAVFPGEAWDGMDTKEFRTISLGSAVSYPDRTLTASGQIEPDVRAKIAAALLSDDGTKALAPLLKYFKADKLLPVDAKSYDAAGALLQQAAGFQ